MAYVKKANTEKKISVYEIVTEKIIDILEKGTIPWQKSSHQTPAMNLITKKPYRGINSMLLAWGYSSPYWLSFAQAKNLGGYVNSGEKASIVVFWTQFVRDKKDAYGNLVKDENGKVLKESIPVLRYYSIFNSEQCTLPEGKIPETPIRESLTSADSIVEGYKDCPEIQYKNISTGEYSHALDVIKMPVEENFTSQEESKATLFHELVHSTGHSNRLNRKEPAEGYMAEYGKEELIAEIGAAFLCYETGIEKTIPNQAAYISGWLNTLKEDKRMIITASSAAQKAVEYILRDNKVVKPIENTSEEQEIAESSINEDVYALL